MPIISLSKVTKAYGTQVLLEDVTLSVNAGDKIGVVGPNGAGKTTLLRVMAGRVHPTAGEVHVARGTRMAFLEQEPDFTGHGTVLEAAESAFARLHEVETELAEVHERLATHPDDTDKLLRRQAELEHEFDDLGGYASRQKAEAVLAGVGFHGDDLSASVDQLSGGERSRLAVAHLLLQQADVLLLDEPTNHLDVEGLEWLEDYLGGFSGTVVVVSHDRQFLDRVAKRIFDFQGARVEPYRGNFSAYLPRKQERLARLQKEYEAQQAFIKREEFYIQKYIAGQRGREAKGRRKRLNRMERLEAPTREKAMHVRIEPALRGGNEVLNLHGLGKAYEGRTLFSRLDLQVLRGDRIGVIGANGCGKTTLLRIICGEEKPDEGKARVGHKIEIGYYRQDRNELDPQRTVLDEVWATAPQSQAGELRNLLGMFLFHDDDVFKHVGDLSGGEQARVALAKLILSRPNFLLLDEPTNHLDIPSRQCLETALNAYGGTLMVVSHDRVLLERVADTILAFANGQAKFYQGTYSQYAKRTGHRGVASAGKPKQKGKTGAAAPRKKTRPKARPIQVLEKLIVEREEGIENIQHAMSDPDLYKVPETVRTLTAQLEALREELAGLYDEWEDAAEAE